MKINIKIIIKTLLLILAIFLIFFLIGIYNIKDRLLQDRKVDSNINEGDYILTRLTSNYEEYLKRKKKELETEKVNLFSEKTIQKSSIEKQRIAIRLSEIEKEKKVIEEEIKKNLEEKRGKEADLSILNKVYKAYEKVLFEKNEDYLKLFKEKEQLESYWRDYVNDIFVFFTEEYEKDLSKKAKIEDRFKIDNGKKYIFEEYDNLLKLSKLKVKEQEEFVDNKKEIIKIEEIAKSTEIKKETSKPETVKKIKDYKYF
ncbi:MAG: hypothetical protein JW924_14200, partial [Fusobacteriaceae bacterium]|nr:hypothetical protein [Fusobacteriaceae bacterium]